LTAVVLLLLLLLLLLHHVHSKERFGMPFAILSTLT
jgi:hypothetical protein